MSVYHGCHGQLVVRIGTPTPYGSTTVRDSRKFWACQIIHTYVLYCMCNSLTVGHVFYNSCTVSNFYAKNYCKASDLKKCVKANKFLVNAVVYQENNTVSGPLRYDSFDVVLGVCQWQTKWQFFVFSQVFIIRVTENGSIMYSEGKLGKNLVISLHSAMAVRQHERRSQTTTPF